MGLQFGWNNTSCSIEQKSTFVFDYELKRDRNVAVVRQIDDAWSTSSDFDVSELQEEAAFWLYEGLSFFTLASLSC